MSPVARWPIIFGIRWQARSILGRNALRPPLALSGQGAPVYGWFTEGFDTLDLKGAKALRGELHA